MELDNKEQIINGLSDGDFNKTAVDRFASYCVRLKKEMKNGNPKNPFMQRKQVEDLVGLFKRVAHEGLEFDGVHVTLQSTGISYDYVAFKNKMLITYPESMIDIQIIYKGDTFAFEKENGQVKYSHAIANPFTSTDADVDGAYCVIKNKRGEFLTTLSLADILKHKKAAKTQYIWDAWFKEMVMKTIVKKACKYHFQDLFTGIEEMDNENYDPELVTNPISELDKLKDDIVQALEVYQGDDIDMIRQACLDASANKTFNIKFANSILEGMNPKDLA